MKLFKRNKGTPEIAATIAMAGAATAVVPNQDSAIDQLIAEMGSTTTPAPTTSTPPVSESDLEAAVAGAEVSESYAKQPGDKSPEEIAAEQKAADEKAKADAKAEKERVAAEKKAQREADAAAKKAKREEEKKQKEAERAAKKAAKEAEKAAKPKRVYFGSDKVGRLQHTLGEKFGDFMVLTTSDAALTGDDLAAKQKETVGIIEAMGSKVKNRATFLIDFVSGKSKELNNVLAICLRTLHADGKIVTGDKGNFHAALIAKPYAPSAARAMGNNTVNCFRQLKLLVPHATEKQTYVANPDSLLLAMANEKLGIK